MQPCWSPTGNLEGDPRTHPFRLVAVTQRLASPWSSGLCSSARLRGDECWNVLTAACELQDSSAFILGTWPLGWMQCTDYCALKSFRSQIQIRWRQTLGLSSSIRSNLIHIHLRASEGQIGTGPCGTRGCWKGTAAKSSYSRSPWQQKWRPKEAWESHQNKDRQSISSYVGFNMTQYSD